MTTYANIGPRGDIHRIVESETPRPNLTELAPEQVSAHAAIVADGKRPFMIDGNVTTLEAFTNGQGTARFVDGEWTIVPFPIPASLANWRVKAVLDIQTLTAQATDPESLDIVESINAYIDSMPPSPDKCVVFRAWHGNGDVEYASPTVAVLKAFLGLTDSQVDDMFRLAAGFNP